MADSIYKKAVPAHIRTFVETLAGKKDPITEKDFTAEELEQIRNAVRSAQANPTIRYSKKDPKGTPLNVVGYDDYGGNRTRRDLDISGASAARNTLGRFRFQKTPDGRTVAIDTYDFADDLADKGMRPSAEYEKMSALEKAAVIAKDTLQNRGGIAGYKTLPSRIGSAFIGKEGRPVSIDLGEGMKKGGAVKAKSHRGDGIAQRGKTKGRFV